jgi:hypothetical protein
MTPRQLHRLLVAPNTLVVDLAETALLALERALRLEHPRLDVDPADDPDLRRQARAILAPAAHLRRELRAYRRALERRLADLQDNDWPF